MNSPTVSGDREIDIFSACIILAIGNYKDSLLRIAQYPQKVDRDRRNWVFYSRVEPEKPGFFGKSHEDA
ncbi:MAG: hypothetical protein JGK38_19055 [Microcoleus sp. PH2017_15_JOR_U_A]|uniref:hypothetical protein n=1 Tax=unclassified Microcoleus TaxID=2642155 RepID=UPI001D955EA9|nr:MULTISPECIES: hypothetical protein [unclassified Microcoleus]TAE69784.1 MAG: hypothetical protein EAZ86_09290 [Oscillatoriales cyanobacterium]MCC3435984.1 hypothetical protein [Microcoleus sp. PH2017_05_CCC_O_A]MCC3451252.1 hypothetical protein [Microcoleus sp. PH2017_09_SFU_O_A]MCC3455795.1 hypothetical protein [Microcoleus sp. PH2017_08_TRC_O_A]MCC3498694.1 hypothetical protein [Microcoleus sp. PH2017_15_JOR_U_A]